ncbi:MAG: tRNA (guanine(10)-N(2))-dimethyltransferase [Thermoplasmata archaeon]|nr:tRNA (guanine(10)-N(2))-dimethyltransferase [Thermoplasmata archaeon]MCK4454955.1 tRNA (guanine(10)-N(2))-dimethyltransferase [Thermoplasmata archaeon]
MSFETEIINEGLAKIEIPRVERLRGPGRKSRLPFYNPLMRTNRDISVLVALATLSDRDTVLDGLAATGASGLRIALETEDQLAVTLNDKNPACHELITRNIERNGTTNCSVTCEDLNSLLSTGRFDLVDVDPFGTPVRFIEGAMRATTDGGIAAITATDTAVLCGSRKKACIRRYGSRPRRTEYCHELGLRILLGYIARAAAKFDRGIEPLLCFSTDHYFRAIVRVRKGARKADSTLEKLGHLHIQRLERELLPETGVAGPLWADAFLDAAFLESVRLPSYFPHKVSKLLELWREEASSPPLFYTTGEVAREFLSEPPALDRIVGALRDEGFIATRTHFRPDAFKTSADVETIGRVLRT